MRVFKGSNGTIELHDTHLQIRKGLMSGNVNKTVYLTDVLGVNIKSAGMQRGGIEIITAADRDHSKHINEAENIILLKMGQKNEAIKFKQAIDQAAMQAKAGCAAPPPQQPAPSSADEILKYQQLMNVGAITPAEFEAKKKQLLGI